MRRLFLYAAATALMTAPAVAQVVDPMAPAPSFQRGSGQGAGGPANELIPETGVPAPVIVAPAAPMPAAPVIVDPGVTGSVIVPVVPINPDDSSTNTRQAPMMPLHAPVPSYQQGSGQQSGGYAKELIPPPR